MMLGRPAVFAFSALMLFVWWQEAEWWGADMVIWDEVLICICLS